LAVPGAGKPTARPEPSLSAFASSILFSMDYFGIAGQEPPAPSVTLPAHPPWLPAPGRWGSAGAFWLPQVTFPRNRQKLPSRQKAAICFNLSCHPERVRRKRTSRGTCICSFSPSHKGRGAPRPDSGTWDRTNSSAPVILSKAGRAPRDPRSRRTCIGILHANSLFPNPCLHAPAFPSSRRERTKIALGNPRLAELRGSW
jgi:hypothetical protein